jgi:hypothetical protein
VLKGFSDGVKPKCVSTVTQERRQEHHGLLQQQELGAALGTYARIDSVYSGCFISISACLPNALTGGWEVPEL